MFKWRVYCTEAGDTGWKTVWSASEPTECPNDPSHTINTQSAQQLSREALAVQTTLDRRVVTLSFMTVKRINYSTSVLGPIRSIRIGSYIEGSTTSYDVKCTDITSQTTLASTTLTNTDFDYSVHDVGTVSSPPSTDFVLEVAVKKNNGTGSIKIEEIVITSESLN